MTTFQIILIIAIPSILIASLIALYLKKLYKKNLEQARQELCPKDIIWIYYSGEKIKAKILQITGETFHLQTVEKRKFVVRKISEVWPLSYQD